jgi:ribosomal protein S18 acetylase RimI-like enzyme
MGRRRTYDFLRGNDGVQFRSIDYTNNPLVIAKNSKMIAINSALEVDLTGQATAESLGHSFYSGIGGQADFMRGAVLSPGGKTILALPSTAQDHCSDRGQGQGPGPDYGPDRSRYVVQSSGWGGPEIMSHEVTPKEVRPQEVTPRGGTVSRIVPFLREGAGVTLTRGDIHYVVTEYGIAYLHGKSIRERAMDLISIAHPVFRLWLIEEAKRLHLIYPDQAFIPGSRGEYPEDLETWKSTRTGLRVLLRPAKISDEPLLKDFFYSLSDESMYQRFISARRDIPHEVLQKLVAVDYFQKMVLIAIMEKDDRESICGLGQYDINNDMFTADVALVVRDDCQNRGVAAELLSYLVYLAKRQGLLGFTAEVLAGNDAVFRLFKKMGFAVSKRRDSGVYELRAMFR